MCATLTMAPPAREPLGAPLPLTGSATLAPRLPALARGRLEQHGGAERVHGQRAGALRTSKLQSRSCFFADFLDKDMDSVKSHSWLLRTVPKAPPPHLASNSAAASSSPQTPNKMPIDGGDTAWMLVATGFVMLCAASPQRRLPTLPFTLNS